MFFDKFLKKDKETAEAEVLSTKAPAEDEATRTARVEKKAAELWQSDRQYLLLSLERADLRTGISFPRVYTEGETRRLQFFTSREALEAYAKRAGYLVDGIIPFAVLENTEPVSGAPVEKQSLNDAMRKMGNLTNLCLTTLPLGITEVSIDEETGNEAILTFERFTELGELDKTKKPSLILTTEEIGKIKEAKEKGENIQLTIKPRFNPLHLEDYVNDYAVTKERGDALIKQIFGRPEKEVFEDLLHNNTLFENCFLSTFIGRSLIPQAKEKKPEDLPYFNRLLELLSRIASKKLEQYTTLYVMGDKETGDVKNNGGNLIVSYTERFRYMLGAQFDYMKFDGLEAVMDKAREKEIKGILITDGPSGCVIRILVPEKKQ